MGFFSKAILLITCVSLASVDCSAGLWSWLTKKEKDPIESISEELIASNLIGRISAEQDAALQVVKKGGTISQKVTDEQWFGSVVVEVKADYEATYGFPFGFIEKGLHIEKDRKNRELIVFLDAPRPLSVAVDTETICVFSRNRYGVRTWKAVPELQGKATKWLSQKAKKEAQTISETTEIRESARIVIRDMVLDLVGEFSSKSQKRALANRIRVIYTDESNTEGAEEIKTPPSIINLSTDLKKTIPGEGKNKNSN